MLRVAIFKLSLNRIIIKNIINYLYFLLVKMNKISEKITLFKEFMKDRSFEDSLKCVAKDMRDSSECQSVSQKVIEKRKRTNMSKYGVENKYSADYLINIFKCSHFYIRAFCFKLPNKLHHHFYNKIIFYL